MNILSQLPTIESEGETGNNGQCQPQCDVLPRQCHQPSVSSNEVFAGIVSRISPIVFTERIRHPINAVARVN